MAAQLPTNMSDAKMSKPAGLEQHRSLGEDHSVHCVKQAMGNLLNCLQPQDQTLCMVDAVPCKQ